MSLRLTILTNIIFKALILFHSAYGQANSNMEIIYSMEYTGMDTLNPNPFRCDAILSQQGNQSSFRLRIPQDSMVEKEKGFNMTLISRYEYSFIKDFEKGQGYFYNEVFTEKKTLYKDSLHPFTWKITGRSKVIHDTLLCYEATTPFRGRYYTAWYCPKIPVSNGPWKMGGLPGIILELQDSHGLLKFKLEKIGMYDNPESALTDLQMPSKKEMATAKSMDEFKRNMRLFIGNLMNIASHQKDDCINCQTTFSVNVSYWEKFSE
ncbi:MAG: GLPGLI family protein [Chitinophagaceae bacterium]|jgi:GLPGLI family protein|nr:GLPGLI family protein [Chitinophagaceae bacterium]